MTTPAVAIGANVYLWSFREQNQLLVELLEPLATSFEAEQPEVRFWFDRFDARGPHIVVLFLGPTDHHAAIKSQLSHSLVSFLAPRTASSGLSQTEIARRHEACRGAVLCSLDAEPGLALENSWALFQQPIEAYPFRITARFPGPAAASFWDLVSDLCHWNVCQLAEQVEHGAPRIGLEFVAAFDHGLRNRGLDAGGFWRFFATTLLFTLPDRLEADPIGTIASLPTAIGEHNRSLFDRLWYRAAEPFLWPRLPELVDLAAVPHKVGFRQPWRPLREVVHWSLKHLGVSVRAEIPLILYAWHRHEAG
jgi:hypothetical protein